jgi:hypothetical protein
LNNHLLSQLRALDRDFLEGRGVSKTRNEAECRLADPGTNAVEEAELPDRRVDRLLVDELLHLIEDRCALLVVEFAGLLREEFVNVGIAAIGIGAALDHERGKPGRRIAEGAAGSLDDPPRILFVDVAREARSIGCS